MMGHRGQELPWENELWDAFPQLSSNMLQSISWMQKFVRISTGLHKLNKDYGKGLSKLVKKEGKMAEDGTSIGVSHKGMMQHLLGLAGKHKQIAVSLGGIAREYEGEAKRLLEEHKTIESEAKKLQGELKSSIEKLEKSRDKYQKRQIEADYAEDILSKAEPDTRVSRAELEKLKENADDRRARANRSRDEYSQQLLLTNSHQKGFYRETWPGIFKQIHKIGKDAEDGIGELLSKLVSGGLDQWPEPVEAWGEIDNFKELLDFRGDFASFVILSKSGNPCPKDFTFVEPPKNSEYPSLSTMGTLRRSLSRQSLRYRTSTFPKSTTKFPSMFSLRNGSIKSHKRSQSNIEDVQKSTDTIDQIDEEDISASRKDDELEVTEEIKMLTARISNYVEDDNEMSFESNADKPESQAAVVTDIDAKVDNESEKNSTLSESKEETEKETENICTSEDNQKSDSNPFETECDNRASDDSEMVTVPEEDESSVQENESEESKEKNDLSKDVEVMNGIEENETNSLKMNGNHSISSKGEEFEFEEKEVTAFEINDTKHADVESYDSMIIASKNYKYDDRKNPFMDEVYDESLTVI